MWKKLKNKLAYWMLGFHHKGIIYGIRNQGKYLRDSRMSNTCIIEHEENLKLGNNVFLGHYSFLEASNGIEIGEGVQVTNYVSIISHSSHHSIRLYGKEFRQARDHIGYLKGNVSIGAYSFIGPHSLIMPNTSIGKGCIVQAYSLLKGNYPDFSIIAGNPAVVVGDTRDSDKKYLEQYPQLLESYREWAERKE